MKLNEKARLGWVAQSYSCWLRAPLHRPWKSPLMLHIWIESTDLALNYVLYIIACDIDALITLINWITMQLNIQTEITTSISLKLNFTSTKNNQNNNQLRHPSPKECRITRKICHSFIHQILRAILIGESGRNS